MVYNSTYYDTNIQITLSLKKKQGIDRFAVLTNFEIQDWRVLSTLPHMGDNLTHRNRLAVMHQHLAIVGVRGQQIVAVFDNDQIAVAAQTAARVDHAAGA